MILLQPNSGPKTIIIGLSIFGLVGLSTAVVSARQSCERTLKIALLSGDDEAYVKVELDMPTKPGKKKPMKAIVGDPKWNDVIISGRTTNAYSFGPCEVIPKGAPVKVRIVRAEAPIVNLGGLIEVQLIEARFGDGETRKITNAASKTIQGAARGKVLWFERTGKKARISPDDIVLLPLRPKAKDAEKGEEPDAMVFYMCPEHCY